MSTISTKQYATDRKDVIKPNDGKKKHINNYWKTIGEIIHICLILLMISIHNINYYDKINKIMQLLMISLQNIVNNKTVYNNFDDKKNETNIESYN